MKDKNEPDRFIPLELIEENAEDLYENAPCGYLSLLPDGTIVKINLTLLKWLSYQREEVLCAKKFQDLLSIGGKIFYETHHAPLMQMQGFVNELNYDFIRKDRTLFPALINCVQITDTLGKHLLNRITVFDITDRKRYELELIQAKKKAEQAAKAKAEFLSTISHEIRTPMNAIMGIANLLLQEDPQPRQIEYMLILKNSSENLLNLINDILDFSKIESGKIMLEAKEFKIRELIHGTLYNLSVKAEEKELTVNVNIDQQLPERVIGDPVKIGQILTNLVGNAIKFTAEGTISVDLKVQELTGNSVLMRLAVTDTGIGIPQDKLEHIFEEFTQASYDINLQYGGTGLGLSISQKLLALHGSKMSVKSEPGKGSTFSFALLLQRPQENANVLADSPIEAVGYNQSLEGVKLLLVEDNQINAFIVSQYLKSWKVEFDIAENGIVAVEKIIEGDYDLVLMDLQMPKLNGYDASRKVRNLDTEKYKKLPILALSASAKIDIKEKMEASGIDDFIGKPFKPHELFDKILTYGKHRQEKVLTNSAPLITAQENHLAPLLDARAGIQLEQFIKLTRNNKKALQKLITITIEDFLHYKSAFREVLVNRDSETLGELAHKIRMMVKLLKAQELDNLITEGRAILEKVETTDENIFALSHKMENTLDAIIQELQQFADTQALFQE